jgi:predicted PurR-regulated permease PerM
METIVLALLQLVQSLLPQIGVSSAAVNTILTTLIQIVPLVVGASQNIIRSVQAVITTMKAGGNLTTDQLAVLDELSSEIDANWQSSVAAYLASKKKVTPLTVQVQSSDSVSQLSDLVSQQGAG